MDNLTSGRQDSQVNRVAKILVDRISSSIYPVGKKIPSERQLALEFGVSRPVIREALSTVSGMDVIDIQMGRGAFVTSLPSERVSSGGFKLQDVINVREVLETGALRLVERRPDDLYVGPVTEALKELRDSVANRSDTVQPDRELHFAIVEASGSRLLSSLWKSIDQQVEETIRISPHGRTMSAEILDVHERLARGLINRDIAEAIHASKSLHEQNRNFLRDLLS